MTLFKNNQLNYETLSPYCGRYATVRLSNGKTYTGQIVEVHRDGILFHSNNPGFIFFPFLAVAALALTIPFAYGLGYNAGLRSPYGLYPYPRYY